MQETVFDKLFSELVKDPFTVLWVVFRWHPISGSGEVVSTVKARNRKRSESLGRSKGLSASGKIIKGYCVGYDISAKGRGGRSFRREGTWLISGLAVLDLFPMADLRSTAQTGLFCRQRSVMVHQSSTTDHQVVHFTNKHP